MASRLPEGDRTVESGLAMSAGSMQSERRLICRGGAGRVISDVGDTVTVNSGDPTDLIVGVRTAGSGELGIGVGGAAAVRGMSGRIGVVG